MGNGLGWSALALSLINPGARVLAVDPETGLELTNRIAEAERLDCRAVRGWSPDDTRRIVAEHGNGPPDLALIDGLHDSFSVLRDFCALFEVSGDACCYLFHDVVNFGLQPALASIDSIAQRCGMQSTLLACAPSGMAAVYPAQAPSAFHGMLGVYRGAEPALAMVAKEAGCTTVEGLGRVITGRSRIKSRV